MIDIVKKYEKTSIVVSILMLILSMFLIAKPEMSVQVLISLFGTVLIVTGIINIISYFDTERDTRLMNFSFAEGILETITGILVVCCSAYLAPIYTVILGIWLIVVSIIKFQLSINLSVIDASGWPAMLIFAILSTIAGFVILFNPFEATIAISMLAGIIIAVYSVLDIIEAIYTLSIVKE